MSNEGLRVIARNRKASHEYFLEGQFEAGLVLRGTEIKSIRAGHVSLKEAYVRLDGREAWLENAHIAPYDPASSMNHDPRRPRKLLLHRREINKLFDQTRKKGYTVVPVRMILRRGKAKVEIALGRGKKQYDKRRELAKRDAQRDVDRALRQRGR